MKRLNAIVMTAFVTAALLTGCTETGSETDTMADTASQTVPETTSAASETVSRGDVQEEDTPDIPEDVYDEPEEELAEEELYTALPQSTAGTLQPDSRTYEQKMQVGTLDEYGGVSFTGDEYVLLSVTMPEDIEVPEGGGFVVINTGAVWHASEGYSPEDLKTDMVSGRTVTVYEEQTGEDGTFEYMLHSSVPDHYSENGIYETYLYIVKRGDYMASVSFTAENYDKETAENILGSLEISAMETE